VVGAATLYRYCGLGVLVAKRTEPFDGDGPAQSNWLGAGFSRERGISSEEGRRTNAGPSASLRSAQDDGAYLAQDDYICLAHDEDIRSAQDDVRSAQDGDVVQCALFAIPYTQVSQVNINERGLYEA
jgi:hypothetical protein